MLASVLLPLAVTGTFTYLIPPSLTQSVGVGQRVIVQFGVRRYYTGIVTAISEGNGEGQKLKPIVEVVDAAPLVLPQQLRLWQWLSFYYMCTEGEVMKAALPSGLKLESETLLLRVDNFEQEAEALTPTEQSVLLALSSEQALSLSAIEKALKVKSLMRPVRHLMQLGAVVVRESVTQAFKARTETHVRLAQAYFSDTAMTRLLDTLRRAPAQEALLMRFLHLSQAGAAISQNNAALLQPVTRQMLCTEAQHAAALAALRKRGVLESASVEVSRLGGGDAENNKATQPTLSQEQQKAFEQIKEAFAEKNVCLLHGVTSSGKTEVYTRLIEDVLAQGQQVLYLVPEIALTTQLTTRLRRVFGARMGVYHSKFPDAERVELWQHQLSNDAFPLILGVRSSLFLPFRNLGLIIVDEEHETSYKQQDPAPRYNARDVATVLARQMGAKVLLGSATPSLESYHNALTGKYALVELLHRYGNVQLPLLVVEDVHTLRRKNLMRTPFSPRLTDEVHAALERGEQAILFQNRRGFSPVLECRSCGWTPRCSRCDVSLTYHQKLGKLVCHYCGAQYSIPKQCPACGDTELRDRGYGTEKIEDAALKVFPEAKAQRMDLDTTRSRTAYEDIINNFASRRSNLLIGTQMVTKGLDFDHVHVVGILSADQMLNVPDFRASERAFQMMMQVAGRAGRRDRQGLVVVQTRQPNNPVIDQVVRADYKGMFEAQMAERKQFHFPPLYRLISIYLKHRNDDVVAHAAEHLAALLRPAFGPELLGPDRPLVSRVQLQYIRKMMVKVAPSRSPIEVRQTLFTAKSNVQHYAVYKGVTIYFDVD